MQIQQFFGMWWFGAFDPTECQLGEIKAHAPQPFHGSIFLSESGMFKGQMVDETGFASIVGTKKNAVFSFRATYDPARSKDAPKFPVHFDLQNEGNGWWGELRYDDRELGRGATPRASVTCVVLRDGLVPARELCGVEAV